MFNFLILSILLTLSACHPGNQITGESKPEFLLRPYSTNNVRLDRIERRKILNHAIFLKLTHKPVSLDLPQEFKEFDGKNYEKHFAKLIVSYANREEVYYVPEESNHEWLLENLHIERNTSNNYIWINKKLSKGKTSFLISTNKEEILKNEVNFIKKDSIVETMSELHLSNISQFQKVSYNIEAKHAAPSFSFSVKEKTMGRKCDDGERATICRCVYKVEDRIEGYNEFQSLQSKEILFSYSVNSSEEVNISGNNFEKSFLVENEENTIILRFKNEIQYSKIVSGIPLNNECVNSLEDRILITERIKYIVKVSIFGTNQKLDDVDLPKEI
jgi:hypothetical protein